MPDINSNMPAIAYESYTAPSDVYASMVLSNSYEPINLDIVPISVIRPKCRQLLAHHLNNIKVILSEDGLPRDWRGVLHCINLPNTNVAQFHDRNNPFAEVFDRWMQERREFATIGQLERILGNIDRWDVIDDTRDFFGKFLYLFIYKL